MPRGGIMVTVINIQKQFKTGLVKTAKGKIFPVKLHDSVINKIKENDTVELSKSQVSGDWLITEVKA